MSNKITLICHLSFSIITHGAFDIADLSSMQDTCHNELNKYDVARHESPSSSVARATDRCSGVHGFDSRRGLRFFSLSHARDKLNIPSFLKLLFSASLLFFFSHCPFMHRCSRNSIETKPIRLVPKATEKT